MSDSTPPPEAPRPPGADRPARRRTDSAAGVDLEIGRVAVLLHPFRRVEGDMARHLLPALEFRVERADVRLVDGTATTEKTRERIVAMGVALGARQAIIPDADLVVTYGGDGSMISAAGFMTRPEACLLGINAGALGFLTEGTLDEGLDILRSIFEGDGWLERRMRLSATVRRDGRVAVQGQAINEVVIRQGRINSLLVLEATVDDVELITFRSDGVIAATPSGSTAYALAVGGPIVHPALEGMVLAPIAPFTLSARPIVMPADDVIRLVVRSDHHDATITFDGQNVHDLATGDRIEIRAAEHPLCFVRVKRDDYFKTLREKLGWHRLRR